MTTKEQEFIKRSFKDGFFRVFDNNADAAKMHELLERNGVKHEYGDYMHKVEGKSRYSYGVRVKDTRKLQDLILSPADEDNPVKDMEQLIKPGANTVEAVEKGESAKVDANSTTKQAQPADPSPAPAPKKATRKHKKVNL